MTRSDTAHRTRPGPDGPAPRVKLFGAFRSGTNYVKALLELNYRVKVVGNEGGFKHAPVPAMFEGGRFRPFPLPIVLVTKAPYPWLVSMWRYVSGPGARHARSGASWEAFLTEPLVVSDGSHPGFPEYRFANPVEYWNAINANVLSLPHRARAVARYESLIEAPGDAVAAIADRFGLQTGPGAFRPVVNRTRNMVDRPRAEIEDYVHEDVFDVDFYRDHRYRPAFTDEQATWVRTRLDAAVCDALGYLRTLPPSTRLDQRHPASHHQPPRPVPIR
ncbi:MAG: hypothetical protein ACR2JP_00675 [Acidimicrobiia bacterium]